MRRSSPRHPLFVLAATALLLGAFGCDDGSTSQTATLPTGDPLEDAIASAALADGEPVDLAGSLASLDLSAAAEEDIDFADMEAAGYAVDCRVDAFRDRVVDLYDADGSGSLDGDERARMREDLAPHPDRRVWEARFHRVQRLRWIYDGDASGDLDADEKEALWQALEQRCMHREAWLLDAFDVDESGALDGDEWAAARDDLAERLAERWNALLDAYDVDADGVLDADERAAARADRLAEILAMHTAAVLEYDGDGNGRLDEDERAKLQEELGARVRSDALLDRIEPPDDDDDDDDDDDKPCRPVWKPRCWLD